jgi:hypothetical protein
LGEHQTVNLAVTGSNPGIPRLGLVAQSRNPATGGPEQGMAWGGGLDNLTVAVSWSRQPSSWWHGRSRTCGNSLVLALAAIAEMLLRRPWSYLARYQPLVEKLSSSKLLSEKGRCEIQTKPDLVLTAM